MIKLLKIEKIEKFRLENKLSATKFCKLCNVSYSVYKKIMNQQPNFRINALFKIAKFMNIHIKDLCINKKLTQVEIYELNTKYGKNKAVK